MTATDTEMRFFLHAGQLLASRLLSSWAAEQLSGGCHSESLKTCWRNIVLDGKRVDGSVMVPKDWDLPHDATLALDYVCLSGCSPPAVKEAVHIADQGVDGVGADSEKLLVSVAMLPSPSCRHVVAGAVPIVAVALSMDSQ